MEVYRDMQRVAMVMSGDVASQNILMACLIIHDGAHGYFQNWSSCGGFYDNVYNAQLESVLGPRLETAETRVEGSLASLVLVVFP